MIKIHWASDIDNIGGNAYGYRRHNSLLKQHVSMIADIDKESSNALLILSPEFYTKKIEGKVNFIFTMFEGTSIPEVYLENLQKADFFFVPSTWVKMLFDKYFDPEKVFVVNHGVTKNYSYMKRTFPPISKPFRFLWIGAPNPRKGYEELMLVWASVFVNNPRFELYIKTTTKNLKGAIEQKNNVILDRRDLNDQELVELYHSAHCFLLPSRGEGFGLTLAEAMATGLPSIATYYSGMTDFFNETVGFPIGYKMGKGVVTFVGDSEHKPHETGMAFPDVNQLRTQMLYVIGNYSDAVKRARLASQRIKENFTWEKSARTLVSVIEEKGQKDVN